MADPNFEAVPDFTDQDHEAIRNALIASTGDNAEQVITRLTTAWQAGHVRRVNAWTVLKAAEVRAAEELERQNRQQKVLDEQAAAAEAERARLETESKKPKMNVFPPGSSAPNVLSLPPSQYALQKISTFDYVELWYFSLPGRTDAAKYSNKSQADDTFGISKLDDHLTVRSIASVRASKNVVPDHELPFSDFLQARNTFLDYAKKADWPQSNLDALAKFFWYLETHPLLQVPLGQRTILTYAARIRHDWHRELKAGRGYDISIINPHLLSTVSDEVRGMDDQQTKSQASPFPLKRNPLHPMLTFFPSSLPPSLPAYPFRPPPLSLLPPAPVLPGVIAAHPHSRRLASTRRPITPAQTALQPLHVAQP